MDNSGCGGSAGAGRGGFCTAPSLQSTQSLRGFLEMQTLSTGNEQRWALPSPAQNAPGRSWGIPLQNPLIVLTGREETQALKAARLPWTDPHFLHAMSSNPHACGSYTFLPTNPEAPIRRCGCSSGREGLTRGCLSRVPLAGMAAAFPGGEAGLALSIPLPTQGWLWGCSVTGPGREPSVSHRS